jgi:peroxiredoxin
MKFIKIALLSFIVALIFTGCGVNGKPTPAQNTGDVTNAGSGSGSGDAEKERKAALDFTLPDMSGKAHTLSKYQGKVVLIDFWASWCPPCRAEIPHLVKIYEKYKSQGLVIIGVGLDKKENLATISKELGLTYTVLVDDHNVTGRLYDVKGIPRTLMLDKKGRIAADHTGFAEGMESELEAEVKKLLSEK